MLEKEFCEVQDVRCYHCSEGSGFRVSGLELSLLLSISHGKIYPTPLTPVLEGREEKFVAISTQPVYAEILTTNPLRSPLKKKKPHLKKPVPNLQIPNFFQAIMGCACCRTVPDPDAGQRDLKCLAPRVDTTLLSTLRLHLRYSTP